MTLLHCAIYTRKSTDEGLEREFNSLDAQREACAAYILSQRHEGWRESRERYDDGGFSGGTMARPGLRRLLDDIAAGRIDVVVVYKVDRLTRALADFAKMVEVFDTAGVSFVSVTQQFNTTTSMGRLTLNVLLSFAQFEREVSAERIRDKIAASKRKGMWMGGVPPLGYDVRDKALHVNAEEAATVRMIYRSYLDLGCVRLLKVELDNEGVRSKKRTSRAGRISGGAQFSRGALYNLLRNPLYIGQIAHKGERHDGRHEAIVERALWDAVQRALDGHGGGERSSPRRSAGRALDGLLFDRHGRPMRPTSASRPIGAGAARVIKRYDYYASRLAEADDSQKPMRVPAAALETAVWTTLATHLADRDWMGAALRGADIAPSRIGDALARAGEVAAMLGGDAPAQAADALRRIVVRIGLGDGEMVIELQPQALLCVDDGATDHHTPIRIAQPLQFRQAGAARPIVIRTGSEPPAPDPDLVALVADARRWMRELASGAASSVLEITEREGAGKGAVSRVLPLAYLAPDIAQAILDGRQPVGLTAKRLRSIAALPLDWRAQRATLGFPAA